MFEWLGPIAAGAALYWASGRCRGRNARKAFRFAAAGSWLLLLPHFQGLISLFIPIISLIVVWAPAIVCFCLAANCMLKEVRAQQRGEYTDAAQ